MIAYPEITQEMQRKSASPPTTRAEAKEQNVPRRSIKDYAGMGGRAIIQGLGDLGEMAQTANPLVALSRGAASILPEGKVKQVVQAFGPNANVLAEEASNRLKLAKAETAKERLAAAALRGATGSIVPGGGAKALVSAALSGATSGLAGEGARQLNLGPAGEVIASVAGGFTPSALRGVKELGGVGKSFIGNADERAGRAFHANVTDRQAAIAELERQRTAVPGSKPTSAELAGDTGLAAFERDRAVTAVTDRRAANAQARTQAAGRTIGEAGDVAAVPALGTRVAQREQARIQADLARQQAAHEAAVARADQESDVATRAAQRQKDVALKQATDDFERAQTAAREGVGSATDVEAAGIRLRTLAEGAYSKIKADTKTLYDKLAPWQEKVVRIKDATLDSIFKESDVIFGSGASPAKVELRKIMDEFVAQAARAKAGGVQTTAKFVTNMDKRLADFAGNMRSTGAENQAAFANKVRSLIDSEIRPQMGPRFNKAYDAAKGSRAKQGELFESTDNVLTKILAKEDFGRYATSDINLPGKLVVKQSDGGNVANRMIAAVGEEASEPLVREQVRRLIDDGKLTAKNVGDFKEALSRYPKVEAHVENLFATEAAHTGRIKGIETAQEANIAAVKAEQAKRVKDITTSTKPVPLPDEFSGTSLGKVAGATDTAQNQISSMLAGNKKEAFKSLLDDVRKEGDPEAAEGLRRALAEHVKTGGGTAKRDAANNIIPDNDRTLRSLEQVLDNSGDALVPAQREALEAIRAELGRTSFVKGAGVPTGHSTRIGTIPGKAITARLIRFALEHATNQKKVDKLIVDALLDPKEAARLLKRPTAARKARMLRSLRGGAIGTSIGVQQALEGQ